MSDWPRWRALVASKVRAVANVVIRVVRSRVIPWRVVMAWSPRGRRRHVWPRVVARGANGGPEHGQRGGGKGSRRRDGATGTRKRLRVSWPKLPRLVLLLEGRARLGCKGVGVVLALVERPATLPTTGARRCRRAVHWGLSGHLDLLRRRSTRRQRGFSAGHSRRSSKSYRWPDSGANRRSRRCA